MIKSAFYALGSLFVVAWSLFELATAVLTGAIEMPAARGHPHRPPVTLAQDPLGFWVAFAIWLLIATLSGYVLWRSIRAALHREIR